MVGVPGGGFCPSVLCGEDSGLAQSSSQMGPVRDRETGCPGRVHRVSCLRDHGSRRVAVVCPPRTRPARPGHGLQGLTLCFHRGRPCLYLGVSISCVHKDPPQYLVPGHL